MATAVLSGSDRRMIFGMMDKALSAIAPKGSGRCRKAMNAADEALFLSSKTATALRLNPEADVEARMLLRARCSLCPTKCRKPLV